MADETQPDQTPDPAVAAAVDAPPAEVTPDPSDGAGGATDTTSPAPAEPTSGEQQPEPEQPAQPAKAVRPVVVNQFTRRSDNDALLGSWVDVVSGEHEGRRGAYVDDDSHNPETGYPERVIVRTRDAENELIVVNYADVRPSAYTGGR